MNVGRPLCCAPTTGWNGSAGVAEETYDQWVGGQILYFAFVELNDIGALGDNLFVLRFGIH